MRKWLCGRGLHGWETWIGLQGGAVVTKKRCTRRHCKTVQVSYWP